MCTGQCTYFPTRLAAVQAQRGGFRKALFRGLEGEISTLGAKGGLVGKGGDAPG